VLVVLVVLVESGIWLGDLVLGEKKADHKRDKDKNWGQDKDKDQSPLIRNIPNQTRRDNPKMGSDDAHDLGIHAPHDLRIHALHDLRMHGPHDLRIHAHVVLELGQGLLRKLTLQ